MANNIVIGYTPFIKNNFFQLNIVYIFPPNNNPIFYGAFAALLNSWEDLISTSFSINFK